MFARVSRLHKRVLLAAALRLRRGAGAGRRWGLRLRRRLRAQPLGLGVGGQAGSGARIRLSTVRHQLDFSFETAADARPLGGLGFADLDFVPLELTKRPVTALLEAL